MAARYERSLLDPDAAPGASVFDHTIWCFASDGDLQEGITSEASSLAGTQRLGNLVVVWDDNHISIEGDTAVAFTEDTMARYAAYGWHVQFVDRSPDGDIDVQGLAVALAAAREETSRPSFIGLRTTIGWPAPTLQNTYKAHGSALGAEEVAASKVILGFDPEQDFFVDPEVLAHARAVGDRGRELRAVWEKGYQDWRAAQPERAALLDRLLERRLPDGWEDALPVFEASEKGQATRVSSGEVLSALGPVLPELFGGSADLASSNNTTIKGSTSFLPDVPDGRQIHFGIREHAMGSTMNGMVLHGKLRPYGGTFMVFSDYMRPRRTPGRPHGSPGDLRLDPRLDRPRRGRTDPPAGRAPHGPAGHPRPRRGPTCGRQRDRAGLGADLAPHEPPGRAVPQPAERPDPRPHGLRLRRRASRAVAMSWPRPPAASRRSSWSAAAPRSRSPSRRARTSRTPASPPGSSPCRAWSGSPSSRRPTATRSSRRR